MKRRRARQLPAEALRADSGERRQASAPCSLHPVISLEVGPDLVPVPGGPVPPQPGSCQPHCGRTENITIVIKMVIFVWGGGGIRGFLFFFLSERWAEVLQDTIQPTLSKTTVMSFSVARCVSGGVYAGCLGGPTGVFSSSSSLGI